MKFAFDREKLEAQMEKLKYAVEPTKQFIEEELGRCKDPRYFYNHYYTVDGKAVDPLSEEQ